MTDDTSGVPVIDLTDPDVLRDPFTAHARARERSPLARMTGPGFPPMWVVTRYEEVRAVLGDSRIGPGSTSYLPLDVPEHCAPYLRTMQEMDGPEHARLRRLVSPAFTARRAAEFRPRIEPLVDALLDDLPDHAENGVVDLLAHLARPLPTDVICELVGVPAADRPRWREYGTAVVSGHGARFAEAVPAIVDGARTAVERRRAEPGDDVLSALLRAGGVEDAELVTLVWHLVLAGQTPTNLIANGVEALLSHPDQLAALRDDPGLVPGAVEELIRWCGPQLLAIPRYAREDVEIGGVLVREGEPVVAALASANRDPRAFADPDRLDVTRAPSAPGHVGFAHGPHFCLGAPLARVQTEVALTALLRRFPDLALAVAPQDVVRAPDPGTWRLAALPVTL
ncbi:cytochrome P450 family protein [Umezawaea beigongshangensis]|uniref:cytochrome P450 family protein n=1 Tax=Umezawaea beigongshangensis TaxID=2780383 RepID=UPI0018F13C84|nr:cytochrome P450 [Umezawaea beigongshangensis]